MRETLSVPLVVLEPLQPPEAMHDVAFVELHVSVEAPPLLTELCSAVIETVGGGSLVDGLTVTPQAANSRDALKASAVVDCE